MSSNNGSTSSGVQWWSNWSSSFPLYLTLAYTVIQPVCVGLGLLGNFWIFCVLLCRSRMVGMTFTIRLYYGTIAVGDFFNCLRHLLWNVLCVSAALYSSDRVYFCFDVLSNMTCVLIHLLYCYTEIVANYALVGLSIERFIAVCLPLYAHTLLSPKWTALILSLLIVPLAIYFTVLVPFAALIYPTVRVTGLICEWNAGLSGTIYSFSIIVILDAAHALAVLVLSLAIFARLRQMSLERSALTSTDGVHGGNTHQSRSGASATLTMIALAVVTVLTYGANSITVVANTLSYYLPGASAQYQLVSLQIFLFFILCTIIPHCINFFIYMVFIPSFRRAAFSIRNTGAVKSTSTT